MSLSQKSSIQSTSLHGNIAALGDTGLATDFDLKGQIEQLLVLLSERERYVIERRFSLDEVERATLEEIGQHFDVTRERIRQIEKNALQKLRRNAPNMGVREVNDAAHALLEEAGGILREDILLSRLLAAEAQGYSMHGLRFLLSLDARFDRLQNTIKLAPYFRMRRFVDKFIQGVARETIGALSKAKDVLSYDELLKQLVAADETREMMTARGLASLCEVHKELKCVEKGVGLMGWKHIHPRTLRDKIFFVLRQKEDSMHFVDIANAISGADFDSKKVNLQAVHNELIRHDDFILIGRGTYALKEWGYSAGTVAEVIEDILKKEGQLPEKKIVEKVLSRRQVKPITILLNLKNKPQFVRAGRKVYGLKKK